MLHEKWSKKNLEVKWRFCFLGSLFLAIRSGLKVSVRYFFPCYPCFFFLPQFLSRKFVAIHVLSATFVGLHIVFHIVSIGFHRCRFPPIFPPARATPACSPCLLTKFFCLASVVSAFVELHRHVLCSLVRVVCVIPFGVPPPCLFSLFRLSLYRAALPRLCAVPLLHGLFASLNSPSL